VTEKDGQVTRRRSEIHEQDLLELKKRKESYIICSKHELFFQIQLRPYRIIHKLPPWSKIVTEKVIFHQQAKNFAAISRNKRPLKVFQIFLHLQSAYLQTIFVR
jgi:hypothetical protein